MKPKQDPATPPNIYNRMWLVACVCCIAPYIQLVTFKSFVMDDAVAVQRNPNVVSPKVTWSDLMRRDFWGLELFSGTWTHKSFRPVTTWTYRAGFKLHGIDSVGFHVANLILHIVCCFTIGLIAYHVLSLNHFWSLFSVALFSAHPIHTENLAYLVGRADIVCSIFFALAIVVSRKLTLSRFLGTVVLSALAGLSKETGFTAPLISAGIWFIYRQSVDWKWIGSLVLSGLTLMGWRHWYTTGTSINMSVQDNPVSYETVWLNRFLSYGYIHAKYFQLLIFPLELCYDYSLRAIAIVSEVRDIRNLFTLCMYSVVFSCLFFGMSGLRRATILGKQVTTCLALMIVPWLPASNILFPVGTVIGERLLYTPSIGFVLMISVVLGHVCLYRPKAIYLAYGLIFLYGIRTAIRTSDWADGDTLFLRDGHRQPASSKTQFNLGITHMSGKNYDKAVAALVRCAAADPMSALPYWRIGQIEILRGNFPSAEKWLMEASTKFSATLMIKDEEIFHDIAVAVFQNKKWDRAHYYLALALEINQRFPKGLNNFGCLWASKDPQKSVQFLTRAVELRPGHELYFDNLAFMAEYTGNKEALALVNRFPKREHVRRDCVWEFVPAS